MDKQGENFKIQTVWILVFFPNAIITFDNCTDLEFLFFLIVQKNNETIDLVTLACDKAIEIWVKIICLSDWCVRQQPETEKLKSKLVKKN